MLASLARPSRTRRAWSQPCRPSAVTLTRYSPDSVSSWTNSPLVGLGGQLAVDAALELDRDRGADHRLAVLVDDLAPDHRRLGAGPQARRPESNANSERRLMRVTEPVCHLRCLPSASEFRSPCEKSGDRLGIRGSRAPAGTNRGTAGRRPWSGAGGPARPGRRGRRGAGSGGPSPCSIARTASGTW